jgi:hypothetical protein
MHDNPWPKFKKGYRIHGQEFLTFFSHLLLDNRYHIWEADGSNWLLSILPTYSFRRLMRWSSEALLGVTLGRSTFQFYLNVATPDKSQLRTTRSLGHLHLRLGMVFWEGIGSTKTIANGEAKAYR